MAQASAHAASQESPHAACTEEVLQAVTQLVARGRQDPYAELEARIGLRAPKSKQLQAGYGPPSDQSDQVFQELVGSLDRVVKHSPLWSALDMTLSQVQYYEQNLRRVMTHKANAQFQQIGPVEQVHQEKTRQSLVDTQTGKHQWVLRFAYQREAPLTQETHPSATAILSQPPYRVVARHRRSYLYTLPTLPTQAISTHSDHQAEQAEAQSKLRFRVDVSFVAAGKDKKALDGQQPSVQGEVEILLPIPDTFSDEAVAKAWVGLAHHLVPSSVLKRI